jgi:hypothetical protein
MDKEKNRLDAGLRSFDHCEQAPLQAVAAGKMSGYFPSKYSVF